MDEDILYIGQFLETSQTWKCEESNILDLIWLCLFISKV